MLADRARVARPQPAIDALAVEAVHTGEALDRLSGEVLQTDGALAVARRGGRESGYIRLSILF